MSINGVALKALIAMGFDLTLIADICETNEVKEDDFTHLPAFYAVMARLAMLKLSAKQINGVLAIFKECGLLSVPADERRRKLERERQARRRARMNITEGEWLRLRSLVFERDGYVCAYCGTDDAKFHVDHIVPVSRGGTSDIENLCVACLECNSSKSDMLLEEWGGSACQ